MLNLSIPDLQLRPDPPMLEVYALGAGVLVAITLLHGGGLGYIVRGYRRRAKRLLQKAIIRGGPRCSLDGRYYSC